MHLETYVSKQMLRDALKPLQTRMLISPGSVYMASEHTPTRESFWGCSSAMNKWALRELPLNRQFSPVSMTPTFWSRVESARALAAIPISLLTDLKSQTPFLQAKNVTHGPRGKSKMLSPSWFSRSVPTGKDLQLTSVVLFQNQKGGREWRVAEIISWTTWSKKWSVNMP